MSCVIAGWLGCFPENEQVYQGVVYLKKSALSGPTDRIHELYKTYLNLFLLHADIRVTYQKEWVLKMKDSDPFGLIVGLRETISNVNKVTTNPLKEIATVFQCAAASIRI